MCHCSYTGVERTPNKSQHSLLWRRKFCCSCQDSNSQPSENESGSTLPFKLSLPVSLSYIMSNENCKHRNSVFSCSPVLVFSDLHQQLSESTTHSQVRLCTCNSFFLHTYMKKMQYHAGSFAIQAAAYQLQRSGLTTLQRLPLLIIIPVKESECNKLYCSTALVAGAA